MLKVWPGGVASTVSRLPIALKVVPVSANEEEVGGEQQQQGEEEEEEPQQQHCPTQTEEEEVQTGNCQYSMMVWKLDPVAWLLDTMGRSNVIGWKVTIHPISYRVVKENHILYSRNVIWISIKHHLNA